MRKKEKSLKIISVRKKWQGRGTQIWWRWARGAPSSLSSTTTKSSTHLYSLDTASVIITNSHKNNAEP